MNCFLTEAVSRDPINKQKIMNTQQIFVIGITTRPKPNSGSYKSSNVRASKFGQLGRSADGSLTYSMKMLARPGG